jgi:hypothetical protein
LWAVARHLGVILVFSVPGVLLWWHAWAGHLGSTLACACGDSGQQVWFVAWPAYALAHGHNPFFTSALYAPRGANLLDSTSSTLVGTALAPVTWLWGPIASTTVALTLTPALSAWGAWVACRRFTTWWPAAVFGGFLYGYSPFVVDNAATGHVMLTLLVVPPLMLVVLHELLVRQRGNVWWWGSALGLLVFGQFLISTELLALMALVCVVGVLGCALLAPRQVAARWPYAVQGLAVGAIVAIVLTAGPAWYALEGPRRITGAPFPGVPIDGNRPFDLWDPGSYAAAAGPLLRISGYEGDNGPPSAYLGIGVLLLMALSLAVAWRRRVAWLMAGLAAVTYVLSFGVFLFTSPTGYDHGQWLPWQFLSTLPLLGRVIPQRFSALTDLCVAVLVAVGLDALWALLSGRRPAPDAAPDRERRPLAGWAHRRTSVAAWSQRPPSAASWVRWRPLVAGLAVTALAAAALVPVWRTYQVPLSTRRVSSPAVLAAEHHHIRDGAVVMVYPFPIDGQSQAMVWQAEDTMRFRLAGGYVKVPGADGHALINGTPGSTVRLLAELSQPVEGPMPSGTPRQIAQLRAALAEWDVDDVVVTEDGRNPDYAAALFTAVIGRLPTWSDHAWVWHLDRVPATPRVRVPAPAASAALVACGLPAALRVPRSAPAEAHQRSNRCVVAHLAPT